MSGSLGGGKSESSNSSSMTQDVWGGQGDALQDMYGQMGNLWGSMGGMFNQQQSMAPWMQGQMTDVYNQANQGYGNMMDGGSWGNTDDIRSKLMGSLDQSQNGSNMGRMYESIVGGAGNDYIDPMVDAMKSGAMENNAMMQSGTAMDAANMGQSGSSRHAMQNAMTNRASDRDMMDKETMMRGDAYDKDLAMKMGIANQADQGVQNTQQRYMDMMSGADQNQQSAMNYGQNMQNLSMGQMAPWMQAMQSPWSMMGQYSNAMGGPTVLSNGESQGDSSGWNFGGSLGL